MVCERKATRTLLSVLILLATLVSVYGDRDGSFVPHKFRNKVSSHKWLDNRGMPEGVSQQWRNELLSNLRNVLRKHNTSPSSPREGTDSNTFGRQEPVSLPAETGSDQIFLLESSSAPMESFGGVATEREMLPEREEKRNGFFFGKRNGFFFGKRTSKTATDDHMILPKYLDDNTFDECRRCGPGGQGRCVMVGTCCSPQFGCYTFTPEAAACMAEDITPCQLTAPSCGRGGQCVANGICCSQAEGACHLEPACSSVLLNDV